MLCDHRRLGNPAPVIAHNTKSLFLCSFSLVSLKSLCLIWQLSLSPYPACIYPAAVHFLLVFPLYHFFCFVCFSRCNSRCVSPLISCHHISAKRNLAWLLISEAARNNIISKSRCRQDVSAKGKPSHRERPVKHTDKDW